MGNKSNIDLGKGTLFIKHLDDEEYMILGDDVVCATIEPNDIADKKIPLLNMLDSQEFECEGTIYVNDLSFRSKVLLFGLRNTIKLTIKNIFKKIKE